MLHGLTVVSYLNWSSRDHTCQALLAKPLPQQRAPPSALIVMMHRWNIQKLRHRIQKFALPIASLFPAALESNWRRVGLAPSARCDSNSEGREPWLIVQGTARKHGCV